MNVVVVIPTYNESANIAKLIDILAEIFPRIPNHDLRLLVVDGNSPDGTSQVVKEKMKTFSWVELLTEQKKGGIGAAYIFGFKHAITQMNADVIVEMDADFQHDPNDLPRMIAKIDEGYDYVIGSRFIKGGSIPKEWQFYRKFLSVGGNIFTKIVLGVYELDDFTSGYKVSRVKGFVDKIDLDAVQSKGFAYKMDLLYKMHLLKAKIAQVPIQFAVREEGESKQDVNNFFDSLSVVLKLRIYRSANFVKFLAVGFTGLFVDSGIFNTLIFTGSDPKISVIVAGFTAMVTTFLLNNFWSFNDRKLVGNSNKIKNFVIYLVTSIVPILVRTKLVYLSILWFGQQFLIYNTAFFIGILFGLVWNYTIYSRIIWKKNL